MRATSSPARRRRTPAPTATRPGPPGSTILQCNKQGPATTRPSILTGRLDGTPIFFPVDGDNFTPAAERAVATIPPPYEATGSYPARRACRCTTSASPARCATGSRTTRPRRTSSTSSATTTSGSSSTGGWPSISAAFTRAQLGRITISTANAATFGMTNGNVYEIVVFQAERQKTSSSYKLTLSGFNGAISRVQADLRRQGRHRARTVRQRHRGEHRRLQQVQRRLHAGAVLRRRTRSPRRRTVRQRHQQRRLRRQDRLRPGLQAARPLRRHAGADRVRRAVRRRRQRRQVHRLHVDLPARRLLRRRQGPGRGTRAATTAPTTAPTAPAAISRCRSPTAAWRPRCGDGVVQDAVRRGLRAEVDANDPDCTVACRKPGICGDGVKSDNEQCDYGATGNTGEYGGCARRLPPGPPLRRRDQERARGVRRRHPRQQLRRLLAPVQAGRPTAATAWSPRATSSATSAPTTAPTPPARSSASSTFSRLPRWARGGSPREPTRSTSARAASGCRRSQPAARAARASRQDRAPRAAREHARRAAPGRSAPRRDAGN